LTTNTSDLQPKPHLIFWGVLVLLLIAVLAVFRDILLPFVAGIVIAYFVNPLVDRLEARGLNRGIAALLIVGLALVSFLLALILVAPMIATQAKQLAVTLPGEAERLRGLLEASLKERLGPRYAGFETAIARGLTDLQTSWSGIMGQVLTGALSRGAALINVLSVLLITPLVTFYLVVDWHAMLKTVETWLPRDHKNTIVALARDIDAAVSAFIRGQGTICLVLGIFYAVGLSLVGLRYGLAVGVVTGALAFIPVAGWAFGLIVALGLAFAQFGLDIWSLALVAGILIAGMAIDTAILSPRLVGEEVGLHPVWLIFSLFAFSYLLGFVGTLIAVPLAAAVVVLVRYALQVYMQSDVYLGDGPGSPGGRA
jgi:predicted PurR-regulated permease PerM